MNNITKDINKEMKNGHDLILLNTDETNPLYRLLIQTSDPLPAHDMGLKNGETLKNIQYKPTGIENALKGLVGGFVYDETQSAHNRKTNPNYSGKKVAKVVSKGYNPDYGGYVDIEPFDSDFVNTLNQALDNRERGLPVLEGPSTELSPLNGELIDDVLEIDELKYTGLAWVNKPRDSRAGVCGILDVNNSFEDILEDKNMTDKIELTKDEYNELIQFKTDKEQLETQVTDLVAEKKQGKADWLQAKQKYDEIKTEKEDLFTQLVPVWNAQGEQKLEMVNSILKTIPEADHDKMKPIYEKMEASELEVIVNSLPDNGNRGIADGQGNGRQNNQKNDDFDPETDETMKQLEKMGYF